MKRTAISAVMLSACFGCGGSAVDLKCKIRPVDSFYSSTEVSRVVVRKDGRVAFADALWPVDSLVWSESCEVLREPCLVSDAGVTDATGKIPNEDNGSWPYDPLLCERVK